MAFSSFPPNPDGETRAKDIAQLLGIGVTEAADFTLAGRLKIIAKLKAAREIEIARGRSGSWLYDVNRHLNLCAALRREYTAFAFFIAENAVRADPPAGAPEQPDAPAGNVVPFPRVPA